MLKKFLPLCLGLLGLTVGVQAAEIRELNLKTNDLIYDPFRKLLYASVPGNAEANANSLIAIDPVTGEVKRTLFVGSEPNKLAISDDGSRLYVGLNGSRSIRPVDLLQWQALTVFPLGVNQHGAPLTAYTIEVVPGKPNDTVVAAHDTQIGSTGVAYFKNGVRLRRLAGPPGGVDVISFSDTPSHLFGLETHLGRMIYRLDLSKQGVKQKKWLNVGDYGSYIRDLRYANGRLYLNNGEVIDPYQKRSLGTFAFHAIGIVLGMKPEPILKRAYYLQDNYFPFGQRSVMLHSFDTETFIRRDSLEISNVDTRVSSFVRWGRDGFAFSTSDGRVFLINWEAVPEGPDLSGSWSRLEQRRQLNGQKVSYRLNGAFAVQNKSDIDVPPTVVRFYLSDDGRLDLSREAVGEASVKALAAGQSREIKVKFSLPKGVSASQRYVIGMVDGRHIIPESDKENNIAVFGPIQ